MKETTGQSRSLASGSFSLVSMFEMTALLSYSLPVADRHEGQGIGDETVVEHEIPGGTVMSGRRADRLRGVHRRAAAHGNHEIHAFSATEGSGAVNRRHALGFDARNLDGANARSFKSLEDSVERPVAAHTAAARDDERRFTAA